MEGWQRRVLVTLGTLVVVMGVLAVGLVIRNALGSSGLTGQTSTTETPPSGGGQAGDSPDSGSTTSTASPDADLTSTTAAREDSTPTLPPPPATFVEDAIRATDLRLQPEGLGPVPFGTGVDRTLAVLTGALGAPDLDSGWMPADVEQLRCPGARARRVTWGSLDVFFSDGPTDWGPDLYEHFFSFAYTLSEDATSPDGPSLRTSEGLQLGAALSRAAAIYGEPSITRDHAARGTFLEVDVPGPGYLLGTFSGPGDEDLLVALVGGMACAR